MIDNLPLFLITGFVAQLIDGTLGMAYGVCCTSLLLSLGISPTAASASVHTAKLFTTGLSGFFHWKYGNIDQTIFRQLLLPGMIGGVVGACILTSIPGDRIKPFVTLYLLFMGLIIVLKAFKKRIQSPENMKLRPLGFIGGFVDAIGGGGWGPVVTSTLLAKGSTPRFAVGSVNLAEFFVTTATTITFVLTLGVINWQIIVGLVVGGLVACPIAAYLCKHIQAKPLMVAVGVLIIGLSIRGLIQNPISFTLEKPSIAAKPQTSLH